MARIVAAALRALLDRLIDYAGMFPPASLSSAAAVANYKRYRSGEHGWMLRWLVTSAAELANVPSELDGLLAVLSDAQEQRAAVIETKRIPLLSTIGHASHLSRPPAWPTDEARAIKRPVYCEVPIQDLDLVQQAGCFAKLRTGGVKPEAIPSVPEVAAFIVACAERRLPFKATAGLHHPIRAVHPLTYEADAPRAMMHGFLNVFLAAAFARHGQRKIEPILAEMDATALHFDDRARWRDWSLDAGQIQEARQQFAHSFGSCSFEEPVQGLKGLGLL
jgi:hypothetical protein